MHRDTGCNIFNRSVFAMVYHIISRFIEWSCSVCRWTF